MKKLSNKRIEIEDLQDERVWIGSLKLGYGGWVYLSQLEDLIRKRISEDGGKTA